jgi:hypothetical protein
VAGFVAFALVAMVAACLRAAGREVLAETVVEVLAEAAVASELQRGPGMRQVHEFAALSGAHRAALQGEAASRVF